MSPKDFTMPTHWRLFKNISIPVSTAEGLAIDDTLPQSVEYKKSPPILHLYTFVPSAIVGKYQDIEAALNLAGCHEWPPIVAGYHPLPTPLPLKPAWRYF